MARPITKKDITRWREWDQITVYRDQHPKLGIIIYAPEGNCYAYSAYNNGLAHWVTGKTLEKRMKLGPPAKRKRKQLMQESMFSLDEMAIAEDIINRG